VFSFEQASSLAADDMIKYFTLLKTELMETLNRPPTSALLCEITAKEKRHMLKEIIVHAGNVGSEAQKEARFGKLPWKVKLFQRAHSCALKLNVHFGSVMFDAPVLADDNEWVLKLPAFARIRKTVEIELNSVIELLQCFKDQPGDQPIRVNQFVWEDRREEWAKDFDELFTEVTKAFEDGAKESGDSLENFTEMGRLIAVLTPLNKLEALLADLRWHIMESGFSEHEQIETIQ